MNILWIEDFGGTLSSGTDTLESMFKNLLSFDDWDEDELNLIKRPTDLKKFCEQQKSVHRIHLCRNYFDYIAFKAAHSITHEIDTIISDIRLDNIAAEQFNSPIPDAYLSDKRKFHENGGFYIFNDLIHLGVPAERICFMTGEKNSFKSFEEKCTEIYTPKVTAFEKSDADYEKLRDWLTAQQSSYAILRRGIIKGCDFLKSHVEKDDHNIQFRDFIKIENNQPTIEIVTTDIKNYLDTLSQFLLLKQPIEQAINIQYRLLLRTLAHEWEDNIEPKRLKEKYAGNVSKIHDIYTFAGLMKLTRNWVSHANLLEPLDHQTIAFLFMVNMRAMFKLPKEIQCYEAILLSCINPATVNNIDTKMLNDDISYTEKGIDEILTGLNINESGHFGKKINAIYRQNTGNPDAEEHNFKQFLLHYFWMNQKSDIRNLTASSNEFLPTFARHIYSRSFS